MDPRTLHKYLYANADPIGFLDPTGRFSLTSLSTVTAIIGIGATSISAGFYIAEGDYKGAAKSAAIDSVLWALGAGVGKLVAPIGKAALGLFSRTFFVPLELGLQSGGAVLTRNMQAVTAKVGFRKPPGWQAHHIVGGAYDEGKIALDILRKKGIDVNSPLNGVYLPGCGAKGVTGVAGLSVHCGKHIREYERYVLESLEEAGGADASQTAIVNVLSRIRRELFDGELVLNVKGNLP